MLKYSEWLLTIQTHKEVRVVKVELCCILVDERSEEEIKAEPGIDKKRHDLEIPSQVRVNLELKCVFFLVGWL